MKQKIYCHRAADQIVDSDAVDVSGGGRADGGIWPIVDEHHSISCCDSTRSAV
ncbi:MAG: hypothetical protein WCD63_18825 [Terrimicrobiaceae bacterium]